MKDKKEKSRNPHGYWIFRWRRRWDSNPRAREGYLISSQARYDHFDTPPCVFFARFFLFFAAGSESPSERTDGKNYGIFNFRAREKPHGYGLCAIRNAQSLRRFRVSPVMTTSIPLHIPVRAGQTPATKASYHNCVRLATAELRFVPIFLPKAYLTAPALTIERRSVRRKGCLPCVPSF